MTRSKVGFLWSASFSSAPLRRAEATHGALKPPLAVHAHVMAPCSGRPTVRLWAAGFSVRFLGSASGAVGATRRQDHRGISSIHAKLLMSPPPIQTCVHTMASFSPPFPAPDPVTGIMDRPRSASGTERLSPSEPWTFGGWGGSVGLRPNQHRPDGGPLLV